jgi:hypothetical protein
MNLKKMTERNFWTLLKKHLQEKSYKIDLPKIQKPVFYGH